MPNLREGETQFNLRLPQTLLAQVEAAAKEDLRGPNSEIVYLLMLALKQRQRRTGRHDGTGEGGS